MVNPTGLYSTNQQPQVCSQGGIKQKTYFEFYFPEKSYHVHLEEQRQSPGG